VTLIALLGFHIHLCPPVKALRTLHARGAGHAPPSAPNAHRIPKQTCNWWTDAGHTAPPAERCPHRITCLVPPNWAHTIAARRTAAPFTGDRHYHTYNFYPHLSTVDAPHPATPRHRLAAPTDAFTSKLVATCRCLILWALWTCSHRTTHAFYPLQRHAPRPPGFSQSGPPHAPLHPLPTPPHFPPHPPILPLVCGAGILGG